MSGISIPLSELLKVSFEGRSTVREERTLRSLSPQMLPGFVHESYPVFVEFVEIFLDFVEKRYSPDGLISPGPYHILKNLIESSDIDTAEIEFVRFMKLSLGRDLPAVTQHNLRSFLKHIKDFYRSKGTKNSIEFFFRSVFNTFSRIYLPKSDLVRASYSTWYVPYVTQLQSLGGGLVTSEGLTDFFDASLYGHTSKQTAWLGLPSTGDYIEILAHSGEFEPGETVTVKKTDGTSIDLWIPLGGIEFREGSFLTDDGMPSSTKRLQDSYYWQDFSYEIISPNEISDITNPLVMNVHPAGFKIFAKVTEENPNIVDPDDGEDISVLVRLTLKIFIDDVSEEDDGSISIIDFPTNYSTLTYSQCFTDVGEFFRDEDEPGFALAFPSSFMLDQSKMFQLERDEPQFDMMAFFGGLKLISGNERTPEYRDGAARLFSYADQVASIGFGGFSLESIGQMTVEEAAKSFVRNLTRRNIRSEIIPVSQDFIDSHRFTFSTLFGEQDIQDAGWNQENTTGKKALIFYNGSLVSTLNGSNRPGPVVNLNSMIDTETGIRISALAISRFRTTKPGAFEIVYLEKRDLTYGTHSASFVLSSNGVSFLECSILPENVSDCLVFKNGKFLIPGSDFTIADYPTKRISFRKPETNRLNDGIDIIVLRHYPDAGMVVEPLVGDDQLYKITVPVDAPLQLVGPSLYTAIGECINWFRLENEPSVEFGTFTSMTASADVLNIPVGPPTFSVGPFDYVPCFDFTETTFLDLAGMVYPFFVNASDEFTINLWIKFEAIAAEQTILWMGQSETAHGGALDNTTIHLKVLHDAGDYAFNLRNKLGEVSLGIGLVYPGRWYMISLRYKGAGNELILESRSLDELGITETLMDSGTPLAMEPYNGTGALGDDESNPALKFYGNMAHFALWNTSLRDHEIKELFSSGRGLDKPVEFI